MQVAAGQVCEPVMRIGLLTSMLSRAGGGVFEAVLSHARMLADLGHQPVLIGIAENQTAADRERLAAFEVLGLARRGPAVIAFAPAMGPSLLQAGLDCLHLHGIWQYASHAGAVWARDSGKPYLISPHGMLDPWILSHGRAKKAAARMVYERRSWRLATMFHALTASEAHDIAVATGAASARIRVIPNAVDQSDVISPADARRREFLYLSRIHPKKNLDGLLAAWCLLAERVPEHGYGLTICGWGEPAHVAEFKARLQSLGVSGASFAGPVFGAEKQERLEHARFMVLPSHSEGLPMAILEAWAAGTPTLMSQACHLEEGFATGAAFDSGTDAEAIAEVMKRAVRLSDAEWSAMSHGAVALVARRFSRPAIAAEWNNTYRFASEANT